MFHKCSEQINHKFNLIFFFFLELRHKDVVLLLRQTGAHFSRDKLDEAGTELCR